MDIFEVHVFKWNRALSLQTEITCVVQHCYGCYDYNLHQENLTFDKSLTHHFYIFICEEQSDAFQKYVTMTVAFSASF